MVRAANQQKSRIIKDNCQNRKPSFLWSFEDLTQFEERLYNVSEGKKGKALARVV
jgi:hypothetical protein